MDKNYHVTMFRPYILMLDGSRMEISQNDAIAYVMEKVNDDICDFGSPFLDDDEDKLKTGEYNENVVFSLDYFDRFLTGRYDLEDYREARTYHFIVKLLAAYLPSDKDVLDYFFVLSDVSKRLTKDRSLSFIRIAIMVAAAICSGVGIVRICLRHTGARTVSRQRLAMARRIRVRDLIRRNACIACGVCAILIPLAVGHTDWMKLYKIYCNQMNRSMGSNADFDYAATNYYEDHGIEKNFDTIKRIYDNDEWQSLTTEQKHETVKAIFDCECKYLGVNNAVSLEFSDNLPSSLYYEVRAQYDSNNRKVMIKDGLLDYDNDEVFMVIAEEVYHAYEHDMMELYSQTLTESQKSLWCFKDVGAWIKNNDSYVIGSNSSYEAYESQPIEEAAKEYATYSWVSYMQNIGDVVDVCYTDENSD